MTYNYRDEYYDDAPVEFPPPPTLLDIEYGMIPADPPLVVKLKKPANLYKDDFKHFMDIKVEPCSNIVMNSIFKENLYNDIIALKTRLARLDKQSYYSARTLANPYELVKSSIFLNRAAVKLAELCTLFDLVPGSNKPFYFADICGGPGGFVEYLVYRKKNARGWGITLLGEQDYSLPPNSNNQFEAVYGADGTGNLYNPKNIAEFAKTVRKTAVNGVDLCVADGGFSVAGDDAHQEEHSKHLIACQVLAGISVLNKGGHLVLKLFDTISPFMAELIYLLYLYFDEIAITKPFSSRPGNSEKYIVALKFADNKPNDLIQFLTNVVEKFWELQGDTKPPTSNHIEHQPQFKPLDQKISDKEPTITHILSNEMILKSTKFIADLKLANTKYI